MKCRSDKSLKVYVYITYIIVNVNRWSGHENEMYENETGEERMTKKKKRKKKLLSY